MPVFLSTITKQLDSHYQINYQMNEYIFERVTPDHYPLLLELFLNAYNLKLTIADIYKRFQSPVKNNSYIGFLAIHQQTGIAVAHYGASPVEMVFEKRKVLAVQGIDAMTHSSHRFKGLFVRLGEMTFEECRRQSISLFFVFTNENSTYGAINKLNCRQIDLMQRFDLKLKIKTFPLSKLFLKTAYIKNLYLKYCRFILRNRIVATPDSFNNSYHSHYAKIFRDRNYLDFKKDQCKFFIKSGNQILWIKLTDILWIGEISDYQTSDMRFIKDLKRLAFFLGYNTISFHLNESVPISEFLKFFKKYKTEPSCIFTFSKDSKIENILYTAADFDTW